MRALLALGLALAAAGLPVAAQTDLDRLMADVVARRDDNWKKQQQYVLEERETFQVDGPARTRLYGFRRDYAWFLRDGVFVRSPVRADGVTIAEDERRREEQAWLQREQQRGERRAERGLDALERIMTTTEATR